MAIKASLPKGTRDFLPKELRQRMRVMDTIRRIYEQHGFEPIETPAIENIETLMGKYGDEGDQLLFKILMRGAKAASGQCDLGLRYDLTVPFSRFVAMHQNEIGRIFKRYQMQPVYRADRPGHGRFREFYQCDIDVIGAPAPLAEISLLHAVSDVFEALNFEAITIDVNDRRILRAMIEFSEIPLTLETSAIMAIDKLDKIGVDGVLKELDERGIAAESAKKLLASIALEASNEATISGLRERLSQFPEALTAIDELEILSQAAERFLKKPNAICVAPALARGLNYYTGAIFEIHAKGLASSLAGGGRYDNLIGSFSGSQIPAVGISLGFERICVILEQNKQLENCGSPVDVIVTLYDSSCLMACLELSSQVRALGFSCELYPGGYAKLQKQFKYANDRGARYVAIIGPEELETNQLTLKDMANQTQECGPLEALRVSHDPALLEGSELAFLYFETASESDKGSQL